MTPTFIPPPRLPDEALAVEHPVGMLDAESTSESAASAEELNRYASAYGARNRGFSPLPLTETNLTEIRARVSELHSRWQALAKGKTIKLQFPDDGQHEPR